MEISTEKSARHAAALGALLGLACGDAAGAVLEFGGKPTAGALENALRFPGGGAHRLFPGQITDDTELAISLADGLLAGRDAGATACETAFSLDAVAAAYSRWVLSQPFDCGKTTGRALMATRRFETEIARRVADTDTELPRTDVADRQRRSALLSEYPFAAQQREAAAHHSSLSAANGSLMRCAPLAVWGHALRPRDLAICARLDSSLTHPNPVCADACACFVIALAHLVAHREADAEASGWAVLLSGGRPFRCSARAARAFDVATSWAFADDKLDDGPETEPKAIGASGVGGGGGACLEVRAWLKLAAQAASGTDVTLPPYEPDEGYVGVAFIHAFRHLLLGSSFDAAIRDVLTGGGDTDTNAAIVGTLVGAAVGLEHIPAQWSHAVLSCTPTAEALVAATAAAAIAGQQGTDGSTVTGDTEAHDAIRSQLVDPGVRGSAWAPAARCVRPAFLHASRLPAVCEQLLASAPARLVLARTRELDCTSKTQLQVMASLRGLGLGKQDRG